MTTGQISGAAVGGAIGLFILLGLLSFVMQRYYRKKRDAAVPPQEKQERPDSKFYTDDIVSTGDLPSPSYKSELPAESMQSPSTRFSGYGSEVEGSPAPGSAGRPVHNGGYEMPGQKGTYYEMSG